MHLNNFLLVHAVPLCFIFFIGACPNILTIQLKRFNNLLQKIRKHLPFPITLNLQPFCENPVSDCLYDLYAVLVHQGYSCFSGHYYSYVKNSNGEWYEVPRNLVFCLFLVRWMMNGFGFVLWRMCRMMMLISCFI